MFKYPGHPDRFHVIAIYNVRNLMNSHLSRGRCFYFLCFFHVLCFSCQNKYFPTVFVHFEKASHVIENMFILANVSCSICYTAAFQFDRNVDVVFFSAIPPVPFMLNHCTAFVYSVLQLFAHSFTRSLTRLPISFDRMVSYKMGAHYMCTVYLVLSPFPNNNNNNTKWNI